MSAEWVKSALPPMLGPLPGWSALPLPYLLLSFSVTSIIVFTVTLATAVYLTAKGRNLNWMVRRIKSLIRGGRIQSRPLGYRRRLNALAHVNYFHFDAWRLK